jgi:hypothetical protein
VRYRQFGRTGWHVSEIGFGGARIGGLLAQDGGRATSLKTLEAASDARVDVLLYEEGADHEAWQCAACGRLSASGGQCPLDGTETDRRDEGLDLAVHQTVAHGGTVWAVTAHEDLGHSEGVGALLRY